MFKPMNVKFSQSNNLKIWPPKDVLLNGGLNLVDKEWKIGNHQTSNVRNMWWHEGELGKRWGQDNLNAAEGVETPAYAAYNKLFNGKIIKHCGTKLYSQDPITGTVTVIYSGLTAQKGSFFKSNQKLYYINGVQYIQWDGITAIAVTPYIPTVVINRTPIGGGNTNEQYNRLGAGFKNSFNSDGTSVNYTLTDTNLDVTIVTCTVNGVAKVEGTDFSVNRLTGVVTFNAAQPAGQNNVIITAYKTDQAAINSILNCKYSQPFGGQNDNRVFLAGNGTGVYYWTGISIVGIDPTYWPYNNYNIIGNYDDNITGFGKHYDTLCIHKVTGEIYGVTYSFNGTTGVFNTFPISDVMGCDCPDTIRTINSNSTWLNTKYGACTMLGTQVGNQRNVVPISRNVDPRLKAELNLTLASCVDFQGHYWLCVNDKVYLWNYYISPYVAGGDPEADAQRLSWWYFDTINAQSFITDGQNLYYIKRDTGLTVKFHVTYDNTQFYDFGGAINSVYRYPFREMGAGMYEFSVLRAWIDVRGDTKSSHTVTYFTSDDPNGDAATESIFVGSFSWDNWSWDNWTWDSMGAVYQWELLPYEKNIRYFGAEIANNIVGTDMNLGSIKFQYSIGKLIK